MSFCGANSNTRAVGVSRRFWPVSRLPSCAAPKPRSQYFTLAYELSSFPWLYITLPMISV
jgi:hypothetical protein